MKHLRIIILSMMAMFAFDTSVSAQVETRATQTFTINGGRWNKVLKNGDTVTIFSYKQDGDTHSFGIYSDDYAGVIDMRGIPFDVDSKQLKKLPKKSKKNLNSYTEMACKKAREKALAGKYRTIANDGILSHDYTLSMVSKNDPIIIIGYKESRGYVSSEYFYSIVKDNSAGIYYNSEYDIVKPIDNVPLPFLPSTDDPQVKAVIDKEQRRIVARREAERKFREEEERRLAAERKAREEKKRVEANDRFDSINKVIREKDFANLQAFSPAFIEVKRWYMDSAGGITVDIQFTNYCSKTVKYVYFRGYFLNAVGDKCRDDITGSTEWKYRGVGPICPFPNTPEEMSFNHVDSWNFDNPKFYSMIADKFRLSSVTIEYMNGGKTTLSGAELKKRVKYAY